MKQILITTFLFFLFIKSFATIRTVSNIDATAQYNTIQAACDASNSGDSVYVSGSTVTYASFTITDKKIAVFGPGWSSNKLNPVPATVNGCTINGAGAAGCELHGLTFVNQVYTNTVNNISFIRNKIQNATIYVGSCSNYMFDGNWFEVGRLIGSNSPTINNFIIRNNIFFGNVAPLWYLSGTNILLDHNLWYATVGYSNIDCFVNCSWLTITNNIFVHRDAANSNISSSFQANITYLCNNSTPWASGSNIDKGNNIAATDPQMVDQASVNNGVDNPLLNFTILSGPANNSGNDGKDRGLLYDAGLGNWTRSRGANLPYILSMILNSSSVGVGDSLKVTVDAKSN